MRVYSSDSRSCSGALASVARAHQTCAFTVRERTVVCVRTICVTRALITMQLATRPLPRRRAAAGSSSSADAADTRMITPPSTPRHRQPGGSPPAPGSRSHHASFDEGDSAAPPPSGDIRVSPRPASSVAEVLGRRKKKEPLAEPCWWCWIAEPDHHPDDCHEKLNLRAPAPAVCVAPAVASDSRQWGHGAPR